jgi:hypothetical protein
MLSKHLSQSELFSGNRNHGYMFTRINFSAMAATHSTQAFSITGLVKFERQYGVIDHWPSFISIISCC